jgi:O-antigen/teichoic acid export membrane protein
MNRFVWANAIRIPTGIFTFLGPLLVLPYSTSLVPIVAVLVASRFISWCAHVVLCARAMPGLFRAVRIDVSSLPPLLTFGGWMTVTNIVGPIMVYMDRFLIASVISTAAVAYYATPYEVITKMWLVSGAMLGVLFPAFSAGLRHDPGWVRRTFDVTAGILTLTLLPLALGIVLFAEETLTLWLGPDFARQSATVTRWLAAGVFINSLAQLPFTLIQGAGRPDLTAKLHLAQLLPYVAGLWWFTKRHGIEGSAIMWTVRVAVDAAMLFVLAEQYLPPPRRMASRVIAVGAAILLLGVAAFPWSMSIKVMYLLAAVAGAGLVSIRLLPWVFGHAAPPTR